MGLPKAVLGEMVDDLKCAFRCSVEGFRYGAHFLRPGSWERQVESRYWVLEQEVMGGGSLSSGRS